MNQKFGQLFVRSSDGFRISNINQSYIRFGSSDFGQMWNCEKWLTDWFGFFYQALPKRPMSAINCAMLSNHINGITWNSTLQSSHKLLSFMNFSCVWENKNRLIVQNVTFRDTPSFAKLHSQLIKLWSMIYIRQMVKVKAFKFFLSLGWNIFQCYFQIHFTVHA